MKTEQELRELDAWIAEHVMGWKRVNFLSYYGKGRFMVSSGGLMVYDLKGESFSPTTNPADAFAVLEKCARKLEEQDNEDAVCITTSGPYFIVEKTTNNGESLITEGPSLALQICLFAQKLFTKETQ